MNPLQASAGEPRPERSARRLIAAVPVVRSIAGVAILIYGFVRLARRLAA